MKGQNSQSLNSPATKWLNYNIDTIFFIENPPWFFIFFYTGLQHKGEISGGLENCNTRNCTSEKGFLGCWECMGYPCEPVLQEDEAWRGINEGMINRLKEITPSEFARHVLNNIGEYWDYGELRFKSGEEIRKFILAVWNEETLNLSYKEEAHLKKVCLFFYSTFNFVSY